MAEEKDDFIPQNPERDPRWNQEPGIAVVPGSHYANYMQKFEQFPSKYGPSPGNPYTYRPFPKMLYRAQRWNGAPACMAAPPDPIDYPNPGELARMEQIAIRFTESCQHIVQDAQEYQKAMEMGWRESPKEAVDFLIARDKKLSQADAEREYDDRGMSPGAKAEVAKELEARGGEPVPEMPESPRPKPTYRKVYGKK